MSWLMTGTQPSPDARVRAILSQLARLRSRVNRQLVEDIVFGLLALLISVGAVGTLAALWLNAREFAAVCVLLAALLAGGWVYALARGVRRWSTLKDAATVADERAGLKNRLTTLLTAPESVHHSPLWPFLVEDSHDQRERFLPVRVAPWRVPRTFFALLLACLLAGLAAFGVKRERALVHAALAIKPPPTLPEMGTLGDVGGRGDAEGKLALPATGDQGSEAGVAVARSGQEIADAAPAGAPPSVSLLNRDNLWSKLSQRADQLAQALQDKIAGREPQREARAFEGSNGQEAALERQRRDSSQQSSSDQVSGAHNDAGASSGAGSGKTQARNRAAAPDATTRQSKPASGEAGKGGLMASGGNALTDSEMTYGQVGEGRTGERDKSGRPAGGAGHGFGSDPEHLFGQPQAPSASSRTFKITMQGNVSNNQVSGSGEPYRPPRADIALNPHQEPDQPMYRPRIAPADREVIKRVFEP
jgi:hypothetical protein